MKKSILRNIAFSVTGAVVGTIAGLAITQKILLYLAEKKMDSTTYELYTSPWGDVAYTKVGSGTPLLLVHSMILGTNKHEWREDLIAELAKKHTVYILDLPGFGQSFNPKQPWTAYQYALLLQSFLEDVASSPAKILAANGGADLALTLSRLCPEWITRLLLISPECFGRGFAMQEETKPLKVLNSPLFGTQKFILATSKTNMRTYLERYYFTKKVITPDVVKRHLISARAGKNAQATFACLQTEFWRTDSLVHFSQISIPYVILWGEENKVTPLHVMEQVQELKEDGDFIIFEKTASLPHLENTAGFIQTIKEYL